MNLSASDLEKNFNLKNEGKSLFTRKPFKKFA